MGEEEEEEEEEVVEEEGVHNISDETCNQRKREDESLVSACDIMQFRANLHNMKSAAPPSRFSENPV